MSFDRERACLLDIIDNIDAINDYVGTIGFAAFAADRKTVDATERCLQRITEAVIRIGPARMSEISPEIPASAIRGMGNVLRHDYDRVDVRSIFDTVADDLPLLRGACVKVLGEHGGA